MYNNVLLSKKSSKANIVALCSESDCVYLEEGAFFVQKHLSPKPGVRGAVSSWEGEGQKEVQHFPVYTDTVLANGGLCGNMYNVSRRQERTDKKRLLREVYRSEY